MRSVRSSSATRRRCGDCVPIAKSTSIESHFHNKRPKLSQDTREVRPGWADCRGLGHHKRHWPADVCMPDRSGGNRQIWHSSVAMGYGCHPARDVALLCALTEAAQVRLTVISGVRDDVTDECYAQLLNTNVITAVQQLFGNVDGQAKNVRHSQLGNRHFRRRRRNRASMFETSRCRTRPRDRSSKPEFGIPVVKGIRPAWKVR